LFLPPFLPISLGLQVRLGGVKERLLRFRLFDAFLASQFWVGISGFPNPGGEMTGSENTSKSIRMKRLRKKKPMDYGCTFENIPSEYWRDFRVNR
jgi:hypothetical protein